MAKFDETSTLALGTQPIPGDSPTGIDGADDENYILVLAELSKHDRIEGDPPDWYSLVSAATTFLQSKSKDVEIAAALGHGLFKQNRYWGLAAALKLLTDLVVNYWDGLFPERPRRRKSRIESFVDVFTEGNWFRENQPKPDDFDAIDLCVTRIDELNAALSERMPDEKPEFDKFIRGLKELAAKRPKPSEPAPAPAAAGADGGAASGGGGGAVFSGGEATDVNSAERAIDKAAAFILKADVTNPLPYAISRLLKWSMIRMPASDDAKYQIPSPEATIIDAIQHQAANALWDHLLTSSEGAFRTEDPLWLDLQKHTCTAMAGLGPQYDNARHVIMAMTAGLVKRLGTGLFELRFRNGQTLCSGDTKMWIESELMAGSGGGGGGGSGGMSNGKLSEASESARKLAGSGKLKEAVAALQEGLAGCSQRRDRFLWRLRIAQLCFDAQRIQLALPLLEECFEDVKRYHIEEWEPSIAVEAAQTLYRCRKALAVLLKEPAPDLEPGVRESFAWLCQLDPSAALAVEPSGK